MVNGVEEMEESLKRESVLLEISLNRMLLHSQSKGFHFFYLSVFLQPHSVMSLLWLEGLFFPEASALRCKSPFIEGVSISPCCISTIHNNTAQSLALNLNIRSKIFHVLCSNPVHSSSCDYSILNHLWIWEVAAKAQTPPTCMTLNRS